MKPYSEDLRERVVAAVERGTKRSDVVEAFAVSLPTIKRWLKQRRETGGLATLDAHCSWWQETTGGEVSTATMSRAITALAWTRKKRR